MLRRCEGGVDIQPGLAQASWEMAGISGYCFLMNYQVKISEVLPGWELQLLCVKVTHHSLALICSDSACPGCDGDKQPLWGGKAVHNGFPI